MTTGVARSTTTIRAARDRANAVVPPQAVPGTLGRRDMAGGALRHQPVDVVHGRASVMARMFRMWLVRGYMRIYLLLGF
jgi:hypothetical protein